MTSINTNASALVALETLRGINNQLTTLNDQISTGRTVNNARDNASVFSIATTIEADVSSLKTLNDSLALGSATVGLARSAAESIVDILTDSQDKIVQAQSTNVDRAKLQEDLNANEAQIQAIVEAASFNGLNLVDNNNNFSFLSSLNRTSTDVTTSSIAITGQDLSTTTQTAGTTAVAAVGDAKGVFTSNGNAVDFAAGVQQETSASDPLADGESEQILFAAQVIDDGETFTYTLDLGDDTVGVATGNDPAAISVTYVAGNGDTSNDVVTGLGNRLTAALEAAGVTGLDVAINTSSNPSQNNVSLVITNNTGTIFDADSSFGVFTGGSAGGALGGLQDIDVVTSDNTASAALGQIDNLLQNALDAAAVFGSAQNRFENQSNFIQSLVDNLELGVSALVDADLTAASAELQSLQVQQQLGLQSLGIANQQPQTILSLFR